MRRSPRNTCCSSISSARSTATSSARSGSICAARQAAHGGWPLYPGGELDISASVKAYYALKLIGDDPAAPHMARARRAILAQGGAARCNVFSRITLALFGQVPWRAVPVMPVEIMLLPGWFPFHLDKVSYWSRTVIVPLLILMAHRPQAANPARVGIAELFVVPPERERDYIANPTGSGWGRFFGGLDRLLRLAEPRFPKPARERALRAAVAFITERLNGEDGLGAIFPAMANTVMAFKTLGYAADHPDLAIAQRAVRKLLVERSDLAYCQPCLSPLWDTALAAHAMMEVANDDPEPRVRRALDWVAERQILDVVGDWARARPGLRPGGWPFEYRNDHYPDVDDTAVIIARAAPRRPRALSGRDRARHRVGAGPAERERRLGLVRRRQHPRLSQQHPVRRPRRAARPADRRSDRALPLHAGAAGLSAQRSGDRAGARVPQARAGAGRLLVRPLGHQLRLRHLVGPVRAERGRRGPAGAVGAQGGRLAGSAPAGRWRLGRELRAATGTSAGPSRSRACPRRPPGRCSA